jgi:hypothetical protein
VEIHNRIFSSLSIADIKSVPFSRKGKTGSCHRLPATISMFSDLLVLLERGGTLRAGCVGGGGERTWRKSCNFDECGKGKDIRPGEGKSMRRGEGFMEKKILGN